MNTRVALLALLLLVFISAIWDAERRPAMLTDYDRARIWCEGHGHHWRQSYPPGCFAALYRDRPILVDTFSR